MKLSELNAHPQLVPVLTELFGSRELAEFVASARPYDSIPALCEAATLGLGELDDDVVAEAVDRHPPIGGRTREGSLSEEEQAHVATSGGDRVESIRRLNRLYRDRFGHVFLICAAGLSADEILDAFRERLTNDPETEWQVMRREFAAINKRRLRKLTEGR